MSALLEAMRKAIEASGKSRYRISLDSGVSQAQLSRFVNGERGMSAENLERLAKSLGLEIVVRPRRRRKGR